MGFGLENKSHRQDIPHGFFQSGVGLELRVGIDIRMHFKLDVVLVQHAAQLISDIHRFSHFGDHSFFETHRSGLPGVLDIHEAALFLPEKNNDRSKLDCTPLSLAVGANT